MSYPDGGPAGRTGLHPESRCSKHRQLASRQSHGPTPAYGAALLADIGFIIVPLAFLE